MLLNQHHGQCLRFAGATEGGLFPGRIDPTASRPTKLCPPLPASRALPRPDRPILCPGCGFDRFVKRGKLDLEDPSSCKLGAVRRASHRGTQSASPCGEWVVVGHPPSLSSVLLSLYGVTSRFLSRRAAFRLIGLRRPASSSLDDGSEDRDQGHQWYAQSGDRLCTSDAARRLESGSSRQPESENHDSEHRKSGRREFEIAILIIVH